MSETPPPAATPPAATPAPAKSGNRVLIIILCVVLGFMLLIGGCVATCTYLVSKKARELSRTAQKNPVYASISLAASLNPDVQVLSKDEDSGKITVRNKKTGETVTINSNDFTSENFGRAIEQMTRQSRAAIAAAGAGIPAGNESAPATVASGSGEAPPGVDAVQEPKISAGKAAAMDAVLAKFPDYTPAYPGGTTLAASQKSIGGIRAGNYVFLSSDKLDAIVDYYEKKATAAGFTVLVRNGDTNDFGPTASLSLMHADPQVTIAISAASKEGGRVQTSIDVTEVGK